MSKKRTVLHSKAGKKLYAVRDDEGQFTDIQTYERAHGQDVRRKSKAEAAVAPKSAKKGAKPAKKKSAKRGK
jgi:hypothetical protein